MTATTKLRLPDFIVIGTMKSGTTTLFRWLEEHPGTSMPSVKEPGFFSDDAVWRRGVDWYGSLFPRTNGNGGDHPTITGEASVEYTDPRRAPIAASRMREVVPNARLICLLREPLERMRSHYRHEVQRGREREPFAVAVGRPGNPYVARSQYFECLAPYLDTFPASQLCIVRLEDLVADGAPGWRATLEHLGLAFVEPPGTAHNVTDDKEQYTRAMRWLWERGFVDRLSPRVRAQGVRRLARRLLLRRDAEYERQLATAEEPAPLAAVEAITASSRKLCAAVGRDNLTWPGQG